MKDEENVTYFAETDFRNKKTRFGIKEKDRSKHVYVIGKSGMGKSTLLENMAAQDIQSGKGIAFIDPHGASAEKLLDYIPEDRLDDVIYFAPFDIEYPVSFNVMEDVGPDARHLVASGLMSSFKKIWVDAWSARMEYILNNVLLALLEYPNSTLLGINRMLADKDYRKKVVDNISDLSVKAFWEDEFAKYGDRYMQEAGAAIQNKIGQFISNPVIRNIIGQPKSSFSVRKIMDEKKIMIMNLSKGRIGEQNANLIGGMLITKIYLGAMSRADMSKEKIENAPNFFFYVDEFQSFVNDSFADILSEARKYKLNLTIAHQYVEQMPEAVSSAVFGNVGTLMAFRVGARDAEVLEKEFGPQFTAQDLVSLGFAQIYIKLLIDGVTSQPFSAVTIPPIEMPEVSYANEAIYRSRQRHTRTREQVEADIKDWHRPVEPSKQKSQPDKNKSKKQVDNKSTGGGKGKIDNQKSQFQKNEKTIKKDNSNKESKIDKKHSKPVENEKVSLSSLSKAKNDPSKKQNSSNKDQLKEALQEAILNKDDGKDLSKEDVSVKKQEDKKTEKKDDQVFEEDKKQEKKTRTDEDKKDSPKEVPEDVLKKIIE